MPSFLEWRHSFSAQRDALEAFQIRYLCHLMVCLLVNSHLELFSADLASAFFILPNQYAASGEPDQRLTADIQDVIWGCKPKC